MIAEVAEMPKGEGTMGRIAQAAKEDISYMEQQRREHSDILSGRVVPDVMQSSDGWYVERFRDGRVVLKADCILTAGEFQTFIECLSRYRRI